MNAATQSVFFFNGGIFYDLRQNFNTNSAAPIPNPLPGEVGSLSVIDSGSKLSINSGRLIMYGGAAINFKDPMIFKVMTRVPGAAMYAKWSYSNHRFVFGGHTSAYNAVFIIQTNINILFITNIGLSSAFLLSITANTEYEHVFVMRSTGSFLFMKLAGIWNLMWVDDFDATPTILAAVTAFSSSAEWSVDRMTTAVLPAPFNDDNGIRFLSIPSPMNAVPYTGLADAITSVKVTAPNPMVGDFSLIFRRADSANYLYFIINSVGTMMVYRVINNTSTFIGTVANVFSSGLMLTIYLITAGTTINIYTATTTGGLTFRLNLVENNFASASGLMININGGWLAADLNVFPRTSPDYTRLLNLL